MDSHCGICEDAGSSVSWNRSKESICPKGLMDKRPFVIEYQYLTAGGLV